MLEILVMCGYYAERTALVETLQQSLGYRRTYQRLCTAAELVYENERFTVAVL